LSAASCRLGAAAKHGNVHGVRAALEEGADVNAFEEEDEMSNYGGDSEEGDLEDYVCCPP